jgi:simple sugar transport system ATP-binding protein
MPTLSFKQVTKRFGSLIANDSVTLSLGESEIMALLGENGAGKTTLMNILFGHYVADEGSIEVDGKTLPPGSTEAAIEAGIGMVHQHFTLADNLTVIENIVLGTESLWSWRQDMAAARRKLVEMAQGYSLAIDPDALVADLSVGERQRVEIMKALYRDARILILDEPTAVLTPQETENLFATLRSLTDQGLSVIFISHKLHEILAISDHIAVLRRGKIVGTIETSNADRNGLAELMVGKAVTRPKLSTMQAGSPVLNINQLNARSADGLPLLVDVNLTVHAHEIIGVAGVAGNGQVALAAVLSGLNRNYSGQLELHGKTLVGSGPSEFVARGIGRIPEDRHAHGMIGDMDIWENLISEDLRAPAVSKWKVIINKKAAIKRAERLIERFDVRCEGALAQTKLLSGGNIQKLILARALSPEPDFILANQPVRGLDEGSIAYVHSQLFEARKRGAGILLISEDLDELMSLCDRIAVIYQGRLSEALPASARSLTELGLMMAGQSEQAPAGVGSISNAVGEGEIHAD